MSNKVLLSFSLIVINIMNSFCPQVLLASETSKNEEEVRIVDKVIKEKDDYVDVDVIIPQISGISNKILDRIVSQKGDTQYGSGGDIFECIKPVDRCRGGIVRADDLDDGARQRRTVLFGYRACYHAVLCRSPAHHCHGEQNEYGQFFHWSVIEILGSGAQAGPRSAKVAACPLHSESVSSFWKVPVRWLNRAAR